MFRMFFAAVWIGCASFGVAHAQQDCAPERLAAAIDAYAAEPYGARAWRKISGLGDPGLAAQSYYDDSWQQRDEWKKLVLQVSSDLVDTAEPAYACRIAYPLSVLKARIARFGPSDPYVKQWLRAQSSVVRACGATQGAGISLPEAQAVTPEQATLLAEDRAYQEASIAFYIDKPRAVELFRAIGASSSPHRAAARYNIANLLANARDIAGARMEVQSILNDQTLASVHAITRELSGFIANIEDSAAGWTSLIDQTMATVNAQEQQILASEEAKRQYTSALYDVSYVGIGAKQGDWWITNTMPENPTLSRALADAARSHPAALWMMTGQTVNQHLEHAPWSLVGPRWRDANASLVDRALALRPAGEHITGLARDALEALRSGLDDASRAKLWRLADGVAKAAAASCGEAKETGAVAALALNAVRVSVQARQYDEVVAGLTSLGLSKTRLYRDVLLQRLAEHVLSAGDAEGARKLRDALGLEALVGAMGQEAASSKENLANFLALIAEDKGRWLQAVQLQANTLSEPVFNLLPARLLRELSASGSFGAEETALLARAAWTRDYVRAGVPGKQVSDAMLALNPKISQAMDSVKADYPGIKGKDLWLLTILRNPRFGLLVNSPDHTDPIEAERTDFGAIDQYDHNDKNWWCPLQLDRTLAAIRKDYDAASGMLSATDYHGKDLAPLLEGGAVDAAAKQRDALLKAHPMIKAVNWKEVNQLAKVASAPKSLTQAAISLAKSGRNASAAPEALGRAVTVTRYGCNWHGRHGAYSSEAQQLLTRKFAKSAWAAKTPYWFDCMAMSWDANYNRVADCKVKVWPQQPPLR